MRLMKLTILILDTILILKDKLFPCFIIANFPWIIKDIFNEVIDISFESPLNKLVMIHIIVVFT